MFQTNIRAVLLLVAAFIVTACATEYQYTPPASEDGKRCVQQCQLTQGSCRNSQFQNASVAQQQCESAAVEKVAHCRTIADIEYDRCQQESQIEYQACLKYSNNRSACLRKSCQKKHCSKPSCYLSANYEFCDSEFRVCYQNCGGKVRIME